MTDEEVAALHAEGIPVKAIAKENGLAYSPLLKRLRRMGVEVRSYRTPYAKRNEAFWFEWTPISAYWLGFMLADGCIVDRGSSHALKLSLAKKDESHIHLFLADYKCEANVRKTRKTIGEKTHLGATVKITLTDAERQHLAEYGLVPRKSETLDLSILSRLPEEFQRDAIRGYVDGDGCIHLSQRGKVWSQVSAVGTQASMVFLQAFINGAVGTKGFIGPDKRSDWLWICKWSGHQAARICRYLYVPSERFLQRKMEQARSVLLDYPQYDVAHGITPPRATDSTQLTLFRQ